MKNQLADTHPIDDHVSSNESTGGSNLPFSTPMKASDIAHESMKKS
jgi:hypothetical protein